MSGFDPLLTLGNMRRASLLKARSMRAGDYIGIVPADASLFSAACWSTETAGPQKGNSVVRLTGRNAGADQTRSTHEFYVNLSLKPAV